MAALFGTINHCWLPWSCNWPALYHKDKRVSCCCSAVQSCCLFY